MLAGNEQREVCVPGDPDESGRSVVSRIASILMAFRSGGTHRLSELAGLAGLPISTTHRLVGELVARRVLERTPCGGYRIGLPLRMIGADGDHRSPPLLDRGLTVIADLAEATEATVRLGVLEGTGIAVAEAAPGRRPAGPLHLDEEPVHRSALGRALLAFSPAAVVDDALASARASGLAPAAIDDLRRVLATTRQSRVAVRQHHGGTTCTLAVPVFGTGGTVLAALEATGVDPKSQERVRSALLVAAGSLSRELATIRPEGTASDADPDLDPDTEPDVAAG
jgi:DNA-binding IclR family transcriptional regulator